MSCKLQHPMHAPPCQCQYHCLAAPCRVTPCGSPCHRALTVHGVQRERTLYCGEDDASGAGSGEGTVREGHRTGDNGGRGGGWWSIGSHRRTHSGDDDDGNGGGDGGGGRGRCGGEGPSPPQLYSLVLCRKLSTPMASTDRHGSGHAAVGASGAAVSSRISAMFAWWCATVRPLRSR